MKLRRIDYHPEHPQNIRVSCDLGQVYPTPSAVTLATISLGKTERCEEDWTFEPASRSYEKGAQGFHFRGAGNHWVTVWLECPEDALTVAEENDPGVVYVVCIPRAKVVSP